MRDFATTGSMTLWCQRSERNSIGIGPASILSRNSRLRAEGSEPPTPSPKLAPEQLLDFIDAKGREIAEVLRGRYLCLGIVLLSKSYCA